MTRLATIFARARNGLAADLVEVEVHVAPGLPGLSIVGLPELAVREARDRVRAAIANSGYEFPARRITVNLAPADLPKEGGRFDLPIALGILVASGQLPAAPFAQLEVLGELSLSGEIRAVKGVLPAALRCRDANRALLVPAANAAEAAFAGLETLYSATQLGVLCAQFQAGLPTRHTTAPSPPIVSAYPDMVDVRGQFQARRAIEIAATGGHSLLMSGPPGSGKSMLASRLPGLLPPLAQHEALEVAAIASVSSGGFDASCWSHRPFRSPHHTASSSALVGGGSLPRPGEITLSHLGVLFLDELPEFDRKVLEALREPLETGRVCISRAAAQIEFPARFQLIAAMNPCPCGHLGDVSAHCRCTPDQVARYRGRLSGPLLDRIDLQVRVPRVDPAALMNEATVAAEGSVSIARRVLAGRELQLARAGKLNSALGPTELTRDCPLSTAARDLLTRAINQAALSARAYHRVLKVARTLADMVGSERIEVAHIAEAVSFRHFDRAA